ncbi:oligosaccharide biosynthesis protein Alg14 like-domain-containing protein [Lophiotrema nucula]|uniref:UDP-N-acetylglucosamine transferase subunit ALG14 n=1 Tax=Lophiotrema nucula TaxID=690887 RepID=A0A6A5ZDQ9_9PLEO|nr:oligosaccharide biosynthesis protein Alg14 like-domain-containing protein [Lophiotrema nucula]
MAAPAPPLSSLYTLSFLLALLTTLAVIASLRLLAILPSNTQTKPLKSRWRPTRVMIVLGSGGHTHEMFYLLRDLDTRKYTHRTYVVSSGDAFSASRAAEFEKELERRGKEDNLRQQDVEIPQIVIGAKRDVAGIERSNDEEKRRACTGPENYDIATVPRARRIHQSILTTPFTSLLTLLSCFKPLLTAQAIHPDRPPQDVYEASARDLPDLIITNGPATAVIVILASLALKFFDIRGANSRGKCKAIYTESFARVKTLSLSGKILLRLVDRFVVQWEELEGKGGKAEFWGILV